jgi:hypothetical protein
MFKMKSETTLRVLENAGINDPSRLCDLDSELRGKITQPRV